MQTKVVLVPRCFFLSLSFPFFFSLLFLFNLTTNLYPPLLRNPMLLISESDPDTPTTRTFNASSTRLLTPNSDKYGPPVIGTERFKSFPINFFSHLKHKYLLSNSSKALCVGARVGQEVEALRRIGVSDSVGVDLVPYPPLVIQGDFHKQPFRDGTFDFEFSNLFDHALYPNKFVGEIERTLKPGGICVLHVAVSKRSDKYSANDLYNIRGLKSLFRGPDCVHVPKVDGFGLDTEVVFRKRKS